MSDSTTIINTPITTAPRPTMTLIDGHAVAYRVFFATQSALASGKAFRTSSGEPTNAVHGFANQLLDILGSKPPPTYLAVVFDAGLSNRDQLFSAYKAQREEMHSDMDVQMERIYELVRAFNIPILRKEGYEADDVIGSVAKLANEQGVDVHIITGDSDLIQLVNPHTTLKQLIPKGDPKFWDEAAVQQRYGLTPAQFVDYKGLVGDTSDNYPGVAGVGDKTATKLLLAYGSLEAVYQHLEDHTGKLRENLENGRENAFISQQLARIMVDLPIDVDLAQCLTHDYDPQTVDAFFIKLEFSSIRKRLGLVAPPPPPRPASQPAQMSMFGADVQAELQTVPDLTMPPLPLETIIVDDEAKLAALVERLSTASAIAFDTETTGIDAISATLVGISLAVEAEIGYYLPVGHQSSEPQLALDRVIAAIRPALTNPAITKHAHNAIYDLIILRRYGIEATPIGLDTMIGEWLYRLYKPDSTNQNGGKGLKDIVRQRFMLAMTKIDELIGKGKNQITMDQVSVERAAPYAAADAAMTYKLIQPIREDLVNSGLWEIYAALENPLIPVITDLNMAGVKLDLPFLQDLSQEFEQRLNDQAEAIYQAAGEPFNIGSPKQLNRILFEVLNLPTKRLSKSSHGFSVDAAALDLLADEHPIIGKIAAWRSLEKLRGTYIDAMPKLVDAQGRIHTSYNQTGTVTGRISSDTPNLQNIPVRTEEGRRVRRAFIAEDGYALVSADYSQIELRILAHYSQDPFLLAAFANDQDIHKATAAAVAGVAIDQVTKEQRYFAKRVNFGLLYGMGAQRLVRESELTRQQAEQFVAQYFERLAGVKAYLDGTKVRAQTEGYLETLRGRRRDFSLLAHPNTRAMDRARLEREAINMPIQGSAADIIKQAMIDLAARLKAEQPRARMILQVHDDLVIEAPRELVTPVAQILVETMEAVGPKFGLAVRLKAEANVGTNWAEMQPLIEWQQANGIS